MRKPRISSTLGQIAKALDQGQTAEKDKVQREEDEHRVARRGRDLLQAMSGTIHTVTILEVNPQRCKMWEYHNRIYNLLSEDSCKDVIESFRNQGQITPAIARKTTDDKDHDYEIICGARRNWAATYLNRDLRLEVRNLTDEEAFLLSDADNKDSQDISEYERGLEYSKMVDLLYGGSQQKLGERVGLSKDVVSDYIALAQLDENIIKAYPDPRWIKRYHAKKLRALWSDKKARTMLLETAGRLASDTEMKSTLMDGAAVLRALLTSKKTKKQKRQVETNSVECTSKNGKKMFTVKWTSRTMSFEVNRKCGASVDEIVDALSRQIRELENNSAIAENRTT